ncbi:MAG TPA: PEP-CTERM sorting domain-containing protein [Phycisphaerae bacterium]|nr:PEP-CTERM sorting domain-containing protein [Phycisphaerae bacterium]HRY68246.1 PEP-CTERM sorting domain-containing protein [Phycisphaerae bacterium]HSA28570.1 PEP-CTERM sorting domain-containing protein [Phycisphaerae bacterium]
MRRPIRSLSCAIALALCSLLAASSQAAQVYWVSLHPSDDSPSANAASAGFTQAPDVGYTDLLTANGHTVTRYVSTATPDAALLNAADLVIVSRSVPSSHYQSAGATAWNSITAPVILLNGYLLRSSRLGYTTGTTIPDIAGTVSLAVNNPSHPVFAGIALDASDTMVNPYANIVTFMGTAERGISVNTNPLAGGGTVLATIGTAGDPAFGGMTIGEWNAGSVLGNGTADILGGHRLALLTGSREHSGLTSEGAGIYDLTADGAQIFLNAVNYMAVPEPSSIALLAFGGLSLALRPRRKA